MLFFTAAISFVLFFISVLCLCLRDSKQDVDPRPDSYPEMTPRSPLGRWRY